MRIVQYWDAGKPPGYVADLLATFRDRNPDLDHQVYDERRATDFIAAHFGPSELAAFRACAVPAMRADYFRYCAILALGGVYADAGFRCTAPLGPLTGGNGGVLFRRDPPGYLFNGFFSFGEPGHPLLRLVLDVATANVERRPTEMVQMVTGPWIFSSLSILHRLSSDGGFRRDRDELESLVEPFRREVTAVVPTPAGRKGIGPMVGPLLETVRNRTRLKNAFEGVRIASYETMQEYVTEPDEPLPYKHGGDHWINWQRSGQTIFR